MQEYIAKQTLIWANMRGFQLHICNIHLTRLYFVTRLGTYLLGLFAMNELLNY